MIQYFKIWFTIAFISVNGTALQGQTEIKQLFSRVLYFDQTGQTGQTPVHTLETLSSNLFSWGLKNRAYYGGKFYQVYHANDGNSSSIYLRSSTDGITWSSRVLVSDDPGINPQFYASLAIGGDPQQPEICVIWNDDRDTNSQLRAAVSTDGGQTFGPSVAISDHTDSDLILADIARDGNGNLYVAWNRRAGNSYYYTWFSRSSDGGLTWTPKMQVYFGRVFSYPAQIVARSAGQVLIGICDDQNNKSNLVTYTSADSGTTWQPQTPATNYGNNTGFRFYSMVKDANDIIHFVHPYADNGSMLEVRHNRSSDWGGSWSPLSAISDTSNPPIQPQLNQQNSPTVAVSPQGHIYAAWADKRLDPNGDNYEVYLTRSTDGGMTWDSEIQINEMPQLDEQIYPVLAVKSDGIIDTVSIVWSELRPNNQPPTSFNLYVPQNNTLLSQIDSIDFNWQEPLDPNGDPLSYILRLWENVAPEGSGAALPVERLLLDTTITGIATTSFRFNGPGGLLLNSQYQWTALVSDGIWSIASIDTFSFFTPPVSFSVNLLEPLDDQVLANSQNPVNFRWSPNINVANGPLTYTFHISNPIADTSIANISDTTLVFDGSQFFESYRAYQWFVLASDGNVTVSSDTFRVLASPGPLSGIYTIGNGGDFLSFTTATQALNNFGVTGPLTFKVLPGTYNNKFEINSYPGQGTANPVVFESQLGDAASVNIRFQPSTYGTPIALIDSIANLTLRKLSFTVVENGSGRHGAIFIRGGQDITVAECVFYGPQLDPVIYEPFDSHLYTFGCEGLRILQNEFFGNRQAIFTLDQSSSIPTSGVEISRNHINDATHMGMELYSLDAPLVKGNVVEQTVGTTGVLLGSCSNGFKVTENRIHVKASQSLNVMFGLVIEGCSGNNDRGLVANNMVLSSASDSTLRTASFMISNSFDVDIWHNTLHVSGFEGLDIPLQATFGIPLRVLYNCGGVRLLNNLLSNSRRGLTLEVGNESSIIESDYNAMYGADRYLAQWNNISLSTIESLRALTGKDANSLSAPPRYYSVNDLHAAASALDGAGIPIPGITEDIDGDPRDPQTPDIGADEFMPQDIGLDGSFTLGVGGDFSEFGEAVDALHMLGISGPVTFNVMAGEYRRTHHFSEIGGSGPTRRVTFQSKSGKTEDVTLSFEQSSQNPNLIRFRDTDFLTFRNLTFNAKLIPSVVGMIRIDRESQGLQFVGNYFNADSSGSTGMLLSAYGDSTAVLQDILIKDNQFNGGNLRLLGDENRLIQGTRIENNRFILEDSLHYFAPYLIRLSHHNAPLISHNRIKTSKSKRSAMAIWLDNCDNGFQVLNNRIQIEGGYRWSAVGIGTSEGNGSRALLANNFIAVENDSGHAGINIAQSTDVDILYNSIHISGGNGIKSPYKSAAIWFYGGQYRLLNNVMANSSGGYVFFNNSSTISESNYNDLFTTGAVLAHESGNNYDNLQNLQAATGRELQSISADPLFVDKFDLHLQYNSPLDNQALAINNITSDIDHQNRHATRPDIGADEFTPSRRIVFRKNRLSLPIPLNPPLRNILNVQLFPGDVLSGYVLSDVNVLIDTVSHNNTADLDLMLLHKGITDTLVFGLNTSGSNFLNTVFDDSASQSINSATPPYSGSFRPYGSLARFHGLDPEGDWELQIYNRGSDTTGVLDAWGLELEFELPSGIDDESERQVPSNFVLSQNYPNPFNPTTSINFQIPKSSRVNLVIYDALGREVMVLVNDFKAAGNHSVQFDARGLSSGLYFYTIRAGEFKQVRKMILLK